MVDERRLAVLRAIVEDFISTSEPVGSKALVERHHLGVSPATIRNDMALLEEEGLIAQPHTSAGRVPTDKGYRVFVDRLATVRPLSSAERRAIASFLDQGVDLDDVLTRTVRLLVAAHPTGGPRPVPAPGALDGATYRCGSAVADPRAAGADHQHGTSRAAADLLPRTGRRADDGRGAPGIWPPDWTIARWARWGRSCRACEQSFAPAERPFLQATVDALLEAMDEEAEERVVIAGAANLTKYGEDFHSTVFPVLEALEEHVVLLRLLSERESDEAITVRIGTENTMQSMSEASVLTAGYRSGSDEIGRIGLVGPTRMDYAANMAAVRAVARYLGRILAEQ